MRSSRSKRSRRKTLGQHFLIDHNIVTQIMDAAQISRNDVVCEAGTGGGILTRQLCQMAKSVVSFEIDKQIFDSTRQEMSSRLFPNLVLINDDLFRANSLKFNIFISNIPYSRSKDAFQWLALQQFDRAIIMIQQEFAAKLVASQGKDNYRAISVIAQYCFDIEKICDVEREAFSPEPQVRSCVIKLKQKEKISREIIRNLETIFSQRNKKASSFVKRMGAKNSVENIRLDQLPVKDLIEIAKQMR